MKVSKGYKVKVDYTGTLEDGKVFDTSEGREPLEFVAGARQVIKGFDAAVIDMEEGEEKEIKIPADEAYGQHRPELVQTVPKEAFGGKLDPEEGQQLMLRAPTGQQMMAIVTKVEGDNVTLDMNHPLVGKELNFKFKIVGVEEGTLEEAAKAEHAGHDCSSCGSDCGPDCAPEEKSEESEEKAEEPEEKAEEPDEKSEEPEEKAEEPDEKSEESEEKSEEEPDEDEVKDALGGQ